MITTKNRKLKGVISVVPTPLDHNENIDEDSVTLLVDRLIRNNMSLFCLGSAGESMNLSFKNRVQAARSFSQANNGRMPLLVGCGGYSTQEILSFIDQIKEEAIDGVHLIPYDSKISPNTVERLFLDVAESSQIPVWVYQNPTRTKPIPIELVKSLSKHPNIAGMKLAGFDLRFNQSFIALERDDFQVFGSADIQMFSFLAHGLKASSSSAAICFPELFTYLYQTMMDGDLNKAREVNNKLTFFLKKLPKTAYLDNGESAAEVKYILSLSGLCREQVARPWREQNEEEKSIAKSVYELYINYLKTNDIDSLMQNQTAS